MAGHDLSLFVDISEDYLKILLCPICCRVLNIPTLTECCQQTYCKSCIERWLKTNDICPKDKRPLRLASLRTAPDVLVNFIGNLRIRCLCKEKVRLFNIEKHQDECPKNFRMQCQHCGAFKHEHDDFECNNILAKSYQVLLDKFQSLNEQVESERKENKDQVDKLLKKISYLETFVKSDNVSYSRNSSLNSPSINDEDKDNPFKNEVKWIKARKGVIPPNAVSGGFTENGESLYVGRAMYKNCLIPGKVIASQGLCFVSDLGKEYGIASYEVLVKSSQTKLTWLSKLNEHANRIKVTNKGQNGTKDKNYPIGRGYYQGSMVIGKVDDDNKVLYITSKGSEISLNDYDVLAIE